MEKIALVTGASRGIGKATALALARDGWTVHVNYIKSREAAEAVAAQTGGMAICADVSNAQAVCAILQGVQVAFDLRNGFGQQRRGRSVTVGELGSEAGGTLGQHLQLGRALDALGRVAAFDAAVNDGAGRRQSSRNQEIQQNAVLFLERLAAKEGDVLDETQTLDLAGFTSHAHLGGRQTARFVEHVGNDG